MREQLEDLIDELSLSDVVRLHGERDGAYVRERLAEAHIFLLASVTASNGDQEGTPVSLMEAQACGLPVLSTLHSGIPEVVADGASGLLVPEGDAEALAGRPRAAHSRDTRSGRSSGDAAASTSRATTASMRGPSACSRSTAMLPCVSPGPEARRTSSAGPARRYAYLPGPKPEFHVTRP